MRPTQPSSRHWPLWFEASLQRRLVALFLGLLLLVQALVFVITRQSVQANARQSLEAELTRAEYVLGRQLEQNTRVLNEGVRLLARDFGFMEAVLSGDQATLIDALNNQAARMRASVVALLDPSGKPLAQGHGGGNLKQALEAAPESNLPASKAQGTVFALIDGVPMQLVRSALKPPQAQEQVLMGFPLSPVLLDELEAISGVQVVLVAQAPNQAARVVSASARASASAAFATLNLGRQELALDAAPHVGEQVAAHTVELARNSTGAVRLVLYKSIDEAVKPYEQLQAILALITVAAVLLFGLGSVATARHVTRPVAELVAAAQRLGRGQFDAQPPSASLNRPDELGALARAFDQTRLGLARAQAHIEELAFRDRLTGLANRVQLEEDLQLALNKPAVNSEAVGLIALNLDRLERVNQLLGRAMGDQVLFEAARRLSVDVQPCWPGSRVARLGGDEFALLLPACTEAMLDAAAQSIDAALEAPMQLGESVVDLSAALGLSWAGDGSPSAEQLLSQALFALAEAKRRREGRVRYAPSLDQLSTKTLSLLGELRRALRQNELRLWLQPKVSLISGDVCGAECLVRWQHPERGLVPPVQFIPFAEETGFIHELSLWVMNAASEAAGKLGGQGLPRLSINLSAHDLMKPALVDELRSSLRAHGARTDQLCLEITESAIATDPIRALTTLHELKADGFKLSIDDFGAGFTSLAQLIELPVDELKLDMIFVRTMDKDADKASMVRSLINMGHDRKLRVVAEGVENATILEQLRQWGCDEGQGWHLGRPMPVDQFIAWMQANPKPGSPI
jgi:diguanylate cyclase (GGDEF)-like protein